MALEAVLYLGVPVSYITAVCVGAKALFAFVLRTFEKGTATAVYCSLILVSVTENTGFKFVFGGLKAT